MNVKRGKRTVISRSAEKSQVLYPLEMYTCFLDRINKVDVWYLPPFVAIFQDEPVTGNLQALRVHETATLTFTGKFEATGLKYSMIYNSGTTE